MRIQYFVSVLYNVFLSKKLDMAYFRTIISLSMAIVIHLFQIGFIFGIINYLIPIGPITNERSIRFMKMGIIFLIIYLSLTLLFPKKIITKIEVSKDDIRKGGKYFICYFIGSFALLVIMMIYNL